MYIHTMKYYPAIKRAEVLIHGTTWINLENTVMEKKPVSKAHLLYNVIYLKCPDKSIEEERELIDGFFFARMGKRRLGGSGTGFNGHRG